MEHSHLFIYFIIALALFFDFLNGFHDAANSIATIVSTRVLKPQWAVLWAAFFNLIAFLFFSLNVANTIGKGLIHQEVVTPLLIFSTLVGAIFWNLVTWYYGLPSSSSHALIGGLIGSAIAQSGFSVLHLKGIAKIVTSIVAAPTLGMIIGLLLMFAVSRIFFNTTPQKVNAVARKLQFVSAALISLGHGGNDAQKTMGIIAILLFSSGIESHFNVPLWVILSCNGIMAFGTLFGGWRIVKTMGMKITKLKPVHGFCAETATALTLFLATYLGIPVSTTHTITGSIVGVGSMNGISAVRWGIARRIVWAWVITLPAAALVAGVVCLISVSLKKHL
ncbi:MAG: putative low-affinity inorganic phosphate transporter [Francisellaceae bacterium]|nr:putative low-affinity inorganic phosphate transporter [Francisellaceae bacterium]